MKMDQNWGVVQRLQIEADTYQGLLGGIMVATVEHKTVEGFSVVTEPDGGNRLHLHWHGGDPLPFKLTGADEIATFIRAWLEKNGVWPTEEPSTDGDTNKGFRLDVRDAYDVVVVKPTYIIYGK